MDVELLYEYIEFSKSMSISTAAKSLYISQSTLSKHLKAIEDDVGVPLLDRSGARLRLTEAGKLFLDGCSVIAHTYDSTLENCHKISRSPEKLSILKPCTIDASTELIYEVMRNMRRENENVSIDLLQMGGYSMIENLLLGRVDCATLHSNSDRHLEDSAMRGIELFPLFEDKVYVWASVESPLISKEHLFVEDLIDVPILVPASRIYMDMHEWIMALCARAGFKPLLVYKDAGDMYELMNSNLKDGVMLLTSEANVGDPVFKMQSNMVVRPFEDKGLKNEVFLAFLKENANPALQTLLTCIKAHHYSIFESDFIFDRIEREPSGR